MLQMPSTDVVTDQYMPCSFSLLGHGAEEVLVSDCSTHTGWMKSAVLPGTTLLVLLLIELEYHVPVVDYHVVPWNHNTWYYW